MVVHESVEVRVHSDEVCRCIVVSWWGWVGMGGYGCGELVGMRVGGSESVWVLVHGGKLVQVHWLGRCVLGGGW